MQLPAHFRPGGHQSQITDYLSSSAHVRSLLAALRAATTGLRSVVVVVNIYIYIYIDTYSLCQHDERTQIRC